MKNVNVNLGDSLFFDMLYTSHYGLVYSIVFDRIKSAVEAEELTHDVLLRVFDRIAYFDASKGKLTSWICAIAKNMAIDYLRIASKTAKKRKSFTDELLAQGGTVSFDRHFGEADEDERRLALCEFVLEHGSEALTNEQVSIIQLRCVEDMPYAEIAELLGITVDHARVLHFRATKLLKQMA